LKRAYHDSLGIQSIIFSFSDDLLQTVYRHPWWHDDEWKSILCNDVFGSLGIEPRSVVRCLLARMPPGCIIDTHHDTGRWATLSHRMHVPVFTDDAVDFRAGVTESSMYRVPFRAGQALELNNRAKHAVHNGWPRHRVHLIFDWVEPECLETLRFVDMSAEQQVFQHRRALFLRAPDQSDDDDPVPTTYAVPSARTRASAFQRLKMTLADRGDDAAPLGVLVRRYFQGELLPSELLGELRANFAVLVADRHRSETYRLLPLTIPDRERSYTLHQYIERL
jgi:Aspartyl/Asparaginyl beta-hydroxylase